jgi:hypothetical protein
MDALVTSGKVIAGLLGVMLVMAAPFAVLTIVMDARQKRRIRQRFSALAIPIDKIQAHKNHYSVSFSHDGAQFCVRCVPGPKGFKWIRETPAFLIQPNDIKRAS